jgi:hypothetical protein
MYRGVIFSHQRLLVGETSANHTRKVSNSEHTLKLIGTLRAHVFYRRTRWYTVEIHR